MSKGTKVSVYNTLLKELHNKYIELYQSGQILEEDYNFVLDINVAKYNKDIEVLRTRYNKEDVINKNPDIFPAEEVFWEYFPKLYSFSFKTKKEQRKFVMEMSDLKGIINTDSLKKAVEEIGDSNILTHTPGGMEGMMKLINNPKFMEMAQKMAKEIQGDPELLESFK